MVLRAALAELATTYAALHTAKRSPCAPPGAGGHLAILYAYRSLGIVKFVRECDQHDVQPLKMRKRKASAASAPTRSTSTALIMLLTGYQWQT
jgi:hypothetical protein